MATETLSVRITADVSNFSSSISRMSNDLQEVSRDFEGLNKLGDGFKNVGKTMSLVGAGMVASIGGIVAKGSEWSAQVEGQKFLFNNLDKAVQNAIDTNSKNAKIIGLTAQQYKNGATDIATYYKNMGLTSDETAKLSGKTMDLVADLGAVKDVPFDEALGDFKSALMGNYEAVDKYGISLSASTLQNSEFVKGLGKSWNQLSDNEKMMAAYNEMTRQGASAQGLAKQEAESFGMKFKYLKEQISETVGEIGQSLLPVLEPLVKKFSETVSKISDWVKENPKLTQAILLFVGILGSLMLVLGPILMMVGSCISIFVGLSSAATVLGIGLLPLSGIMVAIIGAIVGVIAIGVLLCQNWDKVKEFAGNLAKAVGDAWNSMVDWIEEACNSIIEGAQNLWNDMKKGWDSLVTSTTEAWNNMIDFISDILQSIADYVSNSLQSIADFISNTWNSIVDFTSKAWEFIKNLIKVAIMFIAEIISFGVELILLPWTFLWENCKDFLIPIWEGIKEYISTKLTEVSEFISESLEMIANFFSEKFELAKAYVIEKFEFISTTISEFMGAIRDFISGVLDTIATFFYEKFELAKNFVIEKFNLISTTISDFMNSIREFLRGVLDTVALFFQEKFEQAKNFVIEKFTLIKTTISDFMKAASDFVSSTLDSIKNFFRDKLEQAKNFVVEKFNLVKSTMQNKMNEAKNLVAPIIEWIKNKFNVFQSAYNTVSNIFNNIKNSITDKINGAKNAVKNGIDKMKSFFNFSWSLPKLKLPHFSITGGFSINPPKAPKFGISWYSKGGIFKKPTVMGGVGVGDRNNGIGSGAEAILPIRELPKLLGLDKQSTGVNLNIENFNNYSDSDVEELMDKITFELKKRKIGGAF